MANRITIDPASLQTSGGSDIRWTDADVDNAAYLARLALRLQLATLAPQAPPACLLARREPAPYACSQGPQEASRARRWTGPAPMAPKRAEASQEATRDALTWRTVLRVIGWVSGLLPCLWVYYHVARFGLRLLGEKATD